jgi:hypothetical protein
LSTSAIGTDVPRSPIRRTRVSRLPRLGRTGRAGRRLTSWFAVLALAFSVALHAAPPTEAEVKAVFLFNFSQFVSWPTGAFAAADSPLVIGLLGHDPFGRALDAAVSGERAGLHPLIIRRFRSLADVGDCHILYIDRSEAGHLEEILKAVHRHGTLTVSDADHAAERGVMINFATVNHRVQLEINLGEAEASGLTVSSKLLRPSQIVKTGNG